MSWDEIDGQRVGAALSNARSKFGNNKHPAGGDIVFETLKVVVDIEQRRVIRGYSPGLRRKSGMMPDYNQSDLSQTDIADIFKQRMLEIAGGDPPEVVFGLRMSVSPAEIATSEAVFNIFRQCLVGEKQDRDWRILQLMASAGEKPIAKSLAKQFHITASRVYDRRKMQCEAIWSRVKDLIPKDGFVFREPLSTVGHPIDEVEAEVMELGMDAAVRLLCG